MLDLIQSAFFEALGWSLVDSLWQTGALWGVYSLVTFNGKKFNAAIRHNLALMSLAASTTWFFLSLFANYNGLVQGTPLYSIAYIMSGGFWHTLDGFQFMNNVVAVFSTLYIAGIVLYTSGLLLNFVINRNLYRKSLTPAPMWLSNKANEIAVKFKISTRVKIWISSKASSPSVSGLLKPLILFPMAAVNQLTPRQLEAILVHELFHIKRRDYLLNLFLIVAQVLFFFNPFARLLCNVVKKERENSCDDKVIANGYDAWEYSQALYVLGLSAHQESGFAIAATGDNKKLLLWRIKRLLNLKNPSPSYATPLIAFFLCLLVAAFSGRGGANAPVISAEIVLTATNISFVAPPDIRLPVAISYQEIGVGEKQNEKKEVVIKKKVSDAGTDPFEEHVEIVTTDFEFELHNIPVFINDKETLEFTFIVPEKPEAPVIITNECPAPFVPAATFYCPVDSLPAAKTTIVHI
jgi:beta-lactamase regulating signal transducer with metallopeptidase domain